MKTTFSTTFFLHQLQHTLDLSFIYSSFSSLQLSPIKSFQCHFMSRFHFQFFDHFSFIKNKQKRFFSFFFFHSFLLTYSAYTIASIKNCLAILHLLGMLSIRCYKKRRRGGGGGGKTNNSHSRKQVAKIGEQKAHRTTCARVL